MSSKRPGPDLSPSSSKRSRPPEGKLTSHGAIGVSSSSLQSASLGGLSSSYSLPPGGGADLQQLLQQMMQMSSLQQVITPQARQLLSPPSSAATTRSSARNDPFGLTASLDALAGLPSNLHSSMSADLMAALVLAATGGAGFSAPHAQPLPTATHDAAAVAALPQQLFTQSTSQRTPQKQERASQQPSHAPVDLSKVTSTRQHSSTSSRSGAQQVSRPAAPAQSAAMPIDLTTRNPEKHSAFSDPNAGRHNVQVTLRHCGASQSPVPSRQGAASQAQRSAVANNVSVRLSHRPTGTGGSSPALERSRQPPPATEVVSLKSSSESPIDLSKKPGAHRERAALAGEESGSASPAQKVPRQDAADEKANEEMISLTDDEPSPSDFWEHEPDQLPDEVLAGIRVHEQELMAQVKTLQAADAGESQDARRSLIAKVQEELRVEESQLLLVQRLKHLMRTQQREARLLRASSAPAPEKRPSTPQVHVEFANGATSDQLRHTNSLVNVSTPSALSKSPASKTPEKLGKQAAPPVPPTGHQRSPAANNTGGALPGGNSHAHTISSYSVLTKGPTTTPVQQPPQAHGGVTQNKSATGTTAGAFNLTVSQKRAPDSDATAATSAAAAPTSGSSSQSAAIQAQQLQQLQTQLTQGRSQLQRQFERNVLALTPSSTAAPIASAPLRFVPSVTCADFVYLIGLEEVVSAIKNPDQQAPTSVAREETPAKICAQCGTSFSPEWTLVDKSALGSSRKETATAVAAAGTAAGGEKVPVCERCAVQMQRKPLRTECVQKTKQLLGQLARDEGALEERCARMATSIAAGTWVAPQAIDSHEASSARASSSHGDLKLHASDGSSASRSESRLSQSSRSHSSAGAAAYASPHQQAAPVAANNAARVNVSVNRGSSSRAPTTPSASAAQQQQQQHRAPAAGTVHHVASSSRSSTATAAAATTARQQATSAQSQAQNAAAASSNAFLGIQQLTALAALMQPNQSLQLPSSLTAGGAKNVNVPNLSALTAGLPVASLAPLLGGGGTPGSVELGSLMALASLGSSLGLNPMGLGGSNMASLNALMSLMQQPQQTPSAADAAVLRLAQDALSGHSSRPSAPASSAVAAAAHPHQSSRSARPAASGASQQFSTGASSRPSTSPKK